MFELIKASVRNIKETHLDRAVSDHRNTVFDSCNTVSDLNTSVSDPDRMWIADIVDRIFTVVIKTVFWVICCVLVFLFFREIGYQRYAYNRIRFRNENWYR